MITGASVVAAAAILADGDDAFGAGFIAFVVVVALGVASYFLFRSMNRHLKGLPAHFPRPPADDAPTASPAPPGLTPAPESTREHER
jgi:hypothetical protein